jgi:diguanylate cyclase (GGDEF)-like protein/PAS domain S-box-containing protein
VVYDAVHLLSLCSIVVSALYLYLGGYILRSNPRERLNQVFSAICLSFFFWSFAYTFLPGAAGKEQVWIWFRISAVGWTLTPSLLLHFFVLLAGHEGWLERRWVLPAIYLPGAYFLVQAWVGEVGVVDFVATRYGWSDVYGPLSVNFALYLLFFPSAILLGLALVWRWGRKSDLIAQRREAQFIVLTGVPVLGAVTASGILLPWMGLRTPPEVAHLIAPVWVLAIWYSVAAYRLMLMTPAGVASDILRTMADAVLLLSREQRIITLNEAAEDLLESPEGVLKGESIHELFEMEDEVETQAVQRLLSGRRSRNLELRYRSPRGDLIPVRVSASEVEDRHGQIVGQVLVLRDIREQREAEAQLEHLATHDVLTGLPNRSILHDRLQRALDRAGRDKRPFALLMFDLDGLKAINDTYGQKIGDIVLQSTARRLTQATRGLDTVCRLGGDEFMVLVEDLLESGDSDLVARRILDAFDAPIGAGSHAISVTASLGISIYPFDGLDPETLVKKADLALSCSKQRETGGFQFYAPRMDAVNRERTRMEQGLRLALTRDELYLVYQPLVELQTGRIAGVEALLRWRSAEMGLIGPNKFIPVAERCGLIVPIGQWVLETACRTNREWQAKGLPWFPVSVNISAKQLQSEDFLDVVEDILRRTGLSPQLLELELTESTAMADVQQSREVLSRLKDLGVRIVIDDFGTGYSSLVRMKLLPMDAVKVDRSFIENIAEDPRDRALVMAIVALARNLGVEVVAEGVETREQLEVLRSFQSQPSDMFHCDKIQGNFFSGPIAPGEIPDLFLRHRQQTPGRSWYRRHIAGGGR